MGKSGSYVYPFKNMAQVPITGLQVSQIVYSAPIAINASVASSVDALGVGYINIQYNATALISDKVTVTVTLTSTDFGISIDLPLYITVKYISIVIYLI